MGKQVFLYGGSFQPAGLHHRNIAVALTGHADEVIVVPCGGRPDKGTTNSIAPIHRAAIADITFGDIPGVTVELFDLENDQFTRAWELDEFYQARGEVWHVVGSDLIQGGRDGRSQIQTGWAKGPEIWNKLRFVVVPRMGYEFSEADLPPHHQILPEALSTGASTEIRQRANQGLPIDSLVVPGVVDYIERHGVYRFGNHTRRMTYQVNAPRPLVVADDRNPEALRFASLLEKHSTGGRPNLIVVLGGDGTMLHAIQKYWRMRLPFFGINLGHRGFLLNEVKESFSPDLLAKESYIRFSPLLYVEVEKANGIKHSGLAFNDAWVQGEPGRTAWIEVGVNGETRIPKLVGDGVLLATAAGSTAYARAMGGPAVLVGTPTLTLVGNNVLEPIGWKSALLPIDAEVGFRTLDPTPAPRKRPILGFIDGEPQGEVLSMTARASKIAAAELAFLPNHDMAEKLIKLQFNQL